MSTSVAAEAEPPKDAVSEEPQQKPDVVPKVITPVAPPSRIGSKKGRYVPELPAEYLARDKNGDGQIGLYEWERKNYAEFAKLDKNGDGFLTPAELVSKETLKAIYSRTPRDTAESSKPAALAGSSPIGTTSSSVVTPNSVPPAAATVARAPAASPAVVPPAVAPTVAVASVPASTDPPAGGTAPRGESRRRNR
jgi:hypothetical protein